MRFNIARFCSICTDLQLQSVVSDPQFGLPINLVNAGRARIYGVEVELTVRPFTARELGYAARAREYGATVRCDF